MASPSDKLRDRQHLLVALLSAWLILTSPWISMLRRIPSGAGWLDYAHVALGFVTLPLAVAYAIACSRGGGWLAVFPVPVGGDGRGRAGPRRAASRPESRRRGTSPP